MLIKRGREGGREDPFGCTYLCVSKNVIMQSCNGYTSAKASTDI